MTKWLQTLFNEFKNDTIQEIVLNDVRSMLLIKELVVLKKKSLFSNSRLMIEQCQQFSLEQGKRLDPMHPFAGGELKKGNFRWHCIIPPVSISGPIFSMRQHHFGSITLDQYQISKKNKDLLISLFKYKYPLLICGPTGSGKTTLLNTLLHTFAKEERVIILEELDELPVKSHFWIKLLKKEVGINGQQLISIQCLLEQTLRLRPDRIIIGEIRGTELLTFIESINTGHGGSLSTMHAGSLQELKVRIDMTLNKQGFNKSFSSQIKNLWCIFLERKEKPFIKEIIKFY